MHHLILPSGLHNLSQLRAGDLLELSGTVAAARDAAHRLMTETGIIPFDIKTIPVFYTGPTPAPPGMASGSCGPTTSSRMEPFIPEMLQRGMKLVIGKGNMSETTRELFQKYQAVYLAAPGGAGALSATKAVSREVIAWEHLGPEAVSLIKFHRLPVFVAWDLHGGSIYRISGRGK